jgi:hypothetical protein
MLDVHPAPHPASTLREFFVHIITIVIGLLIAIGLEQTVQAIHHRHQREALRHSLHFESEQILKNAKGSDVAASYQMEWLTARMDQVKTALWQRKLLASPPAYNLPHFDYPTDRLWHAGRASGLAEQLTQPEIDAYSEIELLSNKIDAFYTDWQSAESRRLQFTAIFPRKPDNTIDFSKATPGDLRNLLLLLSAEYESTRIFRIWNRYILAAQQTISDGNLNLQDIFNAERSAAFPNGYNPQLRYD